MHTQTLDAWTHSHVFGQDIPRAGERRTRVVVAITAVTMVVEIAAGLAFGSMALLADGLHMASHAAALGISVFAYVYARRHAADRRFSFGTGKVNALAAFASAILLVGFATLMGWESIDRLLNPVDIVFDQAILVAVLGLLVNGASVFILGLGHDADHHGHHGAQAHLEDDAQRDHHDHSGHADHEHPGVHAHHDHNLRAAYLHVLADALTSLLAIVALLAGKLLGATFLDPVMGIVGGILVARWSWGLLRQSGQVLLDHQGPERLRRALVDAIESHGDDRVSDLHLWSVGPGIFALELAVVADEPQPPEVYKDRLPPDVHLAHVVVEVHRCPGHDTG
jgi:cation diffusion facilitator family transporter